jgi:hypothetical protein
VNLGDKKEKWVVHREPVGSGKKDLFTQYYQDKDE